MLEDLKTWIDHGHLTQASYHPPNVLLTPLTVIADIVHFTHYVRLCEVERAESYATILSSIRSSGSLGFCIGTLSAFALACSKDELDLSVFG